MAKKRSGLKQNKQLELCIGPFVGSFSRPSDEQGGGWVRVNGGTIKVLKYKKGNKDKSDMFVVSFYAQHGPDCLNAPIPNGLPYGRKENSFYFKSNNVTHGGYKGRNVIALDFVEDESANKFESFFQDITGSDNCLLSESPATKPKENSQRKSSRIAAASAKDKAHASKGDKEEKELTSRTAKEQFLDEVSSTIEGLASCFQEVDIKEAKDEILRSSLSFDVEKLLNEKKRQIVEARAKLVSNKKEIMRLNLENLDLSMFLQDNFVLEQAFKSTDENHLIVLDTESEQEAGSLSPRKDEKNVIVVDGSDQEDDSSDGSDNSDSSTTSGSEFDRFDGSPIL